MANQLHTTNPFRRQGDAGLRIANLTGDPTLRRVFANIGRDGDDAAMAEIIKPAPRVGGAAVRVLELA